MSRAEALRARGSSNVLQDRLHQETHIFERRPGMAFGAFALLHGTVWVLLPTLLYANLPLDLIEASVYGPEWLLGSDKLPPLPWWLIEIMHLSFGVDAAYYVLAQLTVLAAFAAVYALARPLVGATGALVALLIIDGLHYFQFTSVKFNHDVVQLPLWAFAGLSFRAGLRHGRLSDWAWLGVTVGLALWAKYFVVVLAAPLGLFLLVDRDARNALATPGPWLALVIAGAVMAPHLVWLVQNDFLPLHYADARAASARGLTDHIWHPAQFGLEQLFFLLPSLLIAAPLIWPKPDQPAAAGADAFDRRIVALLAFGPFASLTALSAVTGRGTIALWGYPLWLFLGVWIVLAARARLDARRLTAITSLWAICFTAFGLAFVANYLVLPGIDHRYRAVLFPGERLAAELDQHFRAATGAPPAYVIAPMWEGGNIERYAPSHPRVLIDGEPRRAPWIDLTDLKARGAIVIWTAGDLTALPAQFTAIAAGAQIGSPFELPFWRGGNTLRVGWAILRPAR
jgi:hypothetical protein